MFLSNEKEQTADPLNHRDESQRCATCMWLDTKECMLCKPIL